MDQTAALDWINGMLASAGYEAIHLEVSRLHGEQILRLFIDRLPDLDGQASQGRIGIEDCVRVSHLLDEPLDNQPWIKSWFGESGYELEVSSPGLNRPLRKLSDFEKFTGQRVTIHTFSPLNADETENVEYTEKNPKQKNFLGILCGTRSADFGAEQQEAPSRAREQGIQKVLLDLGIDKPKKAKKPGPDLKVWIPLERISKANLEPDFSEERKQ